MRLTLDVDLVLDLAWLDEAEEVALSLQQRERAVPVGQQTDEKEG